MPTGPRLKATSLVLPKGPPNSLDTVRALCHDLRQPLAAIILLAGCGGDDFRHRMDAILEEAQWLSDMVESVIGGAADDRPEKVDVVDLAAHCVHRAQSTAECKIGFSGTDRAMAFSAPIALSRAVSCMLDNAVRAAGAGGRVSVEVTSNASDIAIRVIDDGPGLGRVPTNNSLGLTITRALVSACGGAFELKPGAESGMVAQILLPTVGSKGTASSEALMVT